MNKIISVWLKAEGGKIVLQKRSGREKSFPFVCQATWSGAVEQGENVMEAIKRECREELGEKFYLAFDFSELKFLTAGKFFRKLTKSEWECHHYMGEIKPEILKLAKLHSDAFSEFIFVDKNTEIFPMSAGKDPKENIVLFDDQYQIFKKITNGNTGNNK